jgi:hypothetical protein
LTRQLASSCIVRFRTDTTADVEFYTDDFYLSNASPARVRYSLSKQEPDAALIRHLLVDGISVPFSCRDGRVCFEAEVDPGSTVKIEIEDQERPPRSAFRGSKLYDAQVRLRRLLSELRDERLARHPRVLKTVARFARRVGVQVGE